MPGKRNSLRRQNSSSRCRGSSRRRGASVARLVQEEEAEMKELYRQKMDQCVAQCPIAPGPAGKAQYNGCVQECDKEERYVPQKLCDSQLLRCSINSKEQSQRTCYARIPSNFLFFPDTSIVPEARFTIPYLYRNRFNKELTGCEELMAQHEMYLSKGRTGPYVIADLQDCQLKKFYETEREENPNTNVDKELRSIACRKTYYKQ
jgi:hypothetical protein